MFGEYERLVEHRILVRRRVEAATMELITVVTNGHVMTYTNRRIVHEPPAGTPEREAERQLPVHLCSRAVKPLVEPGCAERRGAKGATHTLQHVDVARRTDAKVMVSDHAPEPLEAPNGWSGTRCENLIVATADSANVGPRLDRDHDALDPVRGRLGIIIGQRDQLSVGECERCVHRGNHAASSHVRPPKLGPRDRELVDEKPRFIVPIANGDDHLLRRAPLHAQGRKAPREVAWTAVAGDDHARAHESEYGEETPRRTSCFCPAHAIPRVSPAGGRRTARPLRSFRFSSGLYHGKMNPPDRKATQDAFMSGNVSAMIATNAFGLGIDKRDLRFVLHYHFPGSVEAYYQEAGRAGRDDLPATCTILYRVEDSRVQSYFIGGKYPDVEEAAKVALLLEQYPLGERVELDALADRSGVARRKSRIVLALLKRHGLVREHRGGGWERLQSRLTSIDLSADLTDYEARREQDRGKLRAMVRYCQSARCRTRFLLEYFGEAIDADWVCGNCDRCDAQQAHAMTMPRAPSTADRVGPPALP